MLWEFAGYKKIENLKLKLAVYDKLEHCFESSLNVRQRKKFFLTVTSAIKISFFLEKIEPQ